MNPCSEPFATPSGEVLDYTFHAGTEGSRHIAVLGHGVTGNKDRPFVVALAEGLAAAGIHALRFSFAGNGASEGRFADATISKEVGGPRRGAQRLGRLLGLLCRPQHGWGGRRLAHQPRRAHPPARLFGRHGAYARLCRARVRRGGTRRGLHVGRARLPALGKRTWTTWPRSTPWWNAGPRL